MKKTYTRRLLLVCLVSLLFGICGVNTQGQQQTQNPPPPKPQQQTDDDVIRISTDLVQTGVSVFDKKGNFVEGLKKEDFELRVDGKPVELSFFERMAAGSAREEAQVAPTRGDPRANVKQPVTDTVAPKPPATRSSDHLFRR